ncbi:DUF6518 family protein [Nocardiopsis sp. Huas11]|uniref:DUF6518 family protein n=1 Tax=Nocardiopsis sp. Huas11 TaxID=2183912 RepID=UPI0035156F36
MRLCAREAHQAELRTSSCERRPDDRELTRKPSEKHGLVAAAALGLGVLTSYAQGVLPHGLAPLANSSGSWSLAAFLLAATVRGGRTAAVAGPVALLMTVLGYDLGSLLRGFDASLGFTAFWLVAAVVVGTFLGLGGHALRHGTALAPLGAGAMGGVLVGEGAYGLLAIADTTSPVYWTGSAVAGVALVVRAAAARFPRVRPALTAAATCAGTAALFVVVYRIGFFLLLP